MSQQEELHSTLCANKCGRRFWPRRSDHVFCSNKCKQAFARKREKDRKLIAKHEALLANLTEQQKEAWAKMSGWAGEPFESLFTIADADGLGQIIYIIRFMATAMSNLSASYTTMKGL